MMKNRVKRGISFLLSAIMLLSAGGFPTAAFATGNGEYYVSDTGRDGGYFSHLSVTGDDGTHVAYCIDPNVEFNTSYPVYFESEIEGTIKTEVISALNKSYPALSLAQVDLLHETKGITASEAYDGTQAAIWHIVTAGAWTLPEGVLNDNGYSLYLSLIKGGDGFLEAKLVVDKSEAVTETLDTTTSRYGPFYVRQV